MWDKIKAHPYLVGGVAIAGVVLLYLYSKSSGSSGASNFTFSTGPSDAQVVAGTNLQIAQVQANAAVAAQQSQDTAAQSIYQDYFGYLSNNSANQLAAVKNTNAANVSGANLAAQTADYGANANVQIANAQYGSANYIAAQQAASATAINAQNVGATEYVASTQADVANQQNAYAYSENLNSTNVAYQLAAQQNNFQYNENLNSTNTAYQLAAQQNNYQYNESQSNLSAIQQVDDYEIYQSGIQGSGYSGANFSTNGL